MKINTQLFIVGLMTICATCNHPSNAMAIANNSMVSNVKTSIQNLTNPCVDSRISCSARGLCHPSGDYCICDDHYTTYPKEMNSIVTTDSVINMSHLS